MYLANVTKNDLSEDPKLDGKVTQRMALREMGIVNQRRVAQDKDGWSRATGQALVLGQWSHKKNKNRKKKADSEHGDVWAGMLSVAAEQE